METDFNPKVKDFKRKNNGHFPNRSISEAIQIGLLIVDSKWTVKYWNSAAEKLLGVRAKDILGSNL
jgi:PAS domain-containing protein